MSTDPREAPLSLPGPSNEEVGQLKAAIDRGDLNRVIALMSANPTLHQAQLGARGEAALTYVVQRGAPLALEIAAWMLANGSDVHQGGEAPLIGAWRNIPMMGLLLAHGADVNFECWGWGPIIFFSCESLEPEPMKFLLDHGADPNCARPGRKEPGTALDYVISTYVRSPSRRKACIDLLLSAGGTTRYDIPVILDILRGRVDQVAERLAADPALVTTRFPQLDFGHTGGRRLTLRGATLLHVAAEYCNLDVAQLLLDRGADVNARATVDANGIGGQTAIFHSATQVGDLGLPVTRLLVERGADLTVRTKLPGHYERHDEVVECTPLGYAVRFQDIGDKTQTVAFLRTLGAPE